MAPGASTSNALLLDRYRVYDEIAAGGMATVHIGTLVGDVGFSRTVAVKRLHPHFAKDRDIVAMFTDEARIAARIRHPNVVPTLDVISRDGEVFLVMEYVHGEPFSRLLVATSKRKEKIPPRIAAAILLNALHGLHAAHEAKDARGKPLGIVHRDISPQNIIVGSDGVARVLDFGIARAAGRLYQTNDGAVKGKISYMSPEQLLSDPVDRRSDVFAAGVVFWEALTCKRLFAGTGEALITARIREHRVDAPSVVVPGLPTIFDAIVLRALRQAPDNRYPTALAMAEAIETACQAASVSEVAAWVESLSSETLAERARLIERIENAERGASQVSITDEIVTDGLQKRPETAAAAPPTHRVEATVKMATSHLMAGPIAAPVPDPDAASFPGMDVATTVPMRREVRQPVAAPSVSIAASPAPPLTPSATLTNPMPAANVAPTNDVPAYIKALPPRRPAMATIVSDLHKRPPSASNWWLWIAICVGVFILSAGIVVVFFGGNDSPASAPEPAHSSGSKH